CPHSVLGELPDKVPILRYGHFLQSVSNLRRNARPLRFSVAHRSGRFSQVVLRPHHVRDLLYRCHGRPSLCPGNPGREPAGPRSGGTRSRLFRETSTSLAGLVQRKIPWFQPLNRRATQASPTTTLTMATFRQNFTRKSAVKLLAET